MISEDPVQIAKIFSHALETFPTTGMADGVIVKYEQFYLKIYNDNSETEDTIHLYRYNNQHPIIEIRLTWSKMIYVGKLLRSYTTPSQAKTLLEGTCRAQEEDHPICQC